MKSQVVRAKSYRTRSLLRFLKKFWRIFFRFSPLTSQYLTLSPRLSSGIIYAWMNQINESAMKRLFCFSLIRLGARDGSLFIMQLVVAPRCNLFLSFISQTVPTAPRRRRCRGEAFMTATRFMRSSLQV